MHRVQIEKISDNDLNATFSKFGRPNILVAN
jgi:hypothetical protein